MKRIAFISSSHIEFINNKKSKKKLNFHQQEEEKYENNKKIHIYIIKAHICIGKNETSREINNKLIKKK